MKRRDLLKGALGAGVASVGVPYNIDVGKLAAGVCRDRFYRFVHEFWEITCAEKPVWNWHIEYLCRELEIVARRVAEGKPKLYDLVINISPGSTKSTIVSIMFPAWLWTWFPSASFIGSSYTFQLAVSMSRKNRAVIKSEKYQSYYSHVKLIRDQDTKGHFVNVEKGERMCAGIDGDIIGRHGDFILIDDPLNPKGARSEAELESANVFITETLSNRKKNKDVVPTIMIMQRLHENDPTGMMLDLFGDRIKHICIPAELTKDVKPASLKKYYQDGLMDKKRLSRAVLEEAKKIGDFYYSGQFLQSPIPLGGGMFRTEKFKLEDIPPEKWAKRVRYWDKAGTSEDGAYTVGVLMGKNCDGRFWVLDIVRGRWDAFEREKKIKQVAEIDGKAVIIGVEQEGGSGGKESAEATLRNLAGWRVRLDRPTGDKAQRADPYAVQVNGGNVSMIKADWNRPYINELSFFPHSKYKDQTDASSGAFKILNQPEIFVGAF